MPSASTHRAFLWAKATVRSSSGKRFFPLFFEHFKSDYHGSFQGFYATDTEKLASCWNGNILYHWQNPVTPTDWTVDHEFAIAHKMDQSQCSFFIDGANVSLITSPYVAAQPFEIESCEVDGVHSTLYEKFPPGITLP